MTDPAPAPPRPASPPGRSTIDVNAPPSRAAPSAVPASSPAQGPRADAARRTRRRLLVAGGAAGLAAGVALAWWRHAPGDADADALAGLWSLAPPRPDGTPLPMAGFRGRPLLLNFWATWCPPCVRELPALAELHAAARGPSDPAVVALAVDAAEAVRAFVARHAPALPVAVVGLEGLTLAKRLGNDTGGLPFTVGLAADGRVLATKLGEGTVAEWRGWFGASGGRGG